MVVMTSQGRQSLTDPGRNKETGEMRWPVYVFNQKVEVVASYDLLTMNTP